MKQRIKAQITILLTNFCSTEKCRIKRQITIENSAFRLLVLNGNTSKSKSVPDDESYGLENLLL